MIPDFLEEVLRYSGPGAALARSEARISLERILARLGDISIAPAIHGPPSDRRFSYMPTYVFRAVQELHLRFTPIAGA